MSLAGTNANDALRDGVACSQHTEYKMRAISYTGRSVSWRRTATIAGPAAALLCLSLAWAELRAQPGEEWLPYAHTQDLVIPPDRREEGEGPYNRLLISNVSIIDGTGAPPFGPSAVEVRNDEIAAIHIGRFDIENILTESEDFDRIIDGKGGYLLPGFINVHVHIPELHPSYAFRMWLSHGITTVREVGSPSLYWLLELKERAARNTITAPDIEAYPMFPYPYEEEIASEDAERWVKTIARKGADGIKLRNLTPRILEVVVKEAQKAGLGTAFHIDRRIIARINAMDIARLGVDSLEHQLGLPESLLVEQTIQDFPGDYDYGNELDRIRGTGHLWQQAVKPGSEAWNNVIREFVELDFTIDPTLAVYEANRDAMRARTAEWHEDYTLQHYIDFWEPNPANHFSHFYDWKLSDEIAWKNYFRTTMEFLDDFKDASGRVTVGADEGYLYNIFGFGFIREMELLQEAGFHPLEVVQAATLHGAELIGKSETLGTIELGKKADLLLIPENPLDNLKVLYGHGHLKLDEDSGTVARVGSVAYTIKDGIVFDTQEMLAEIRRVVANSKNTD